jgi:3-hydroxyacyl-[acyl-carrier-protein] dehydratase
MLQGNFFYITQLSFDERSVSARLEFNPGHRIFDGHFPQTPVVPGVCMVAIVKEVLEEVIKKETRLLQAAHIKFLHVIDPRYTKSVSLDLKYHAREDSRYDIIASLFEEGQVYFKFKGLVNVV